MSNNVTDHPTLIKNQGDADARRTEVFGASNVAAEVWLNGTVTRMPIEYVVARDFELGKPGERVLEVERTAEDHIWKVVTDIDSYYYVWFEEDKLTADQIDRLNATTTPNRAFRRATKRAS
jgi:hypothetical protein